MKTWTANPLHNKFPIEQYKDIGWHPTTKLCNHNLREYNNSLVMNSGSDRLFICDECKYFYHIDSSD